VSHLFIDIVRVFQHIRMNSYTTHVLYTSYISLLLFIEILYIYSIYICFLITVAVGTRMCLNDPSLIIFFSFPVEQKSGEVICISTAYDILSITMHLPLEAPYRKITNERKREFLSTLGRMQALLVSYTVGFRYNYAYISAQMHMDIRLYSIVCNYSSDKHCLLSFNLK